MTMLMILFAISVGYILGLCSPNTSKLLSTAIAKALTFTKTPLD